MSTKIILLFIRVLLSFSPPDHLTVLYLHLLAAILSETAISYSPLRAGQPSSIQVKFKPTVFIASGGVFVVSLPDFTSEIQLVDMIVASDPPDTMEYAIWNSTSSELSVRTLRDLESNVSVSFTTPIVNGLSLPRAGLTENQQSLTLELKAATRFVAPFSIRSSPAVGYFAESSIEFSPSISSVQTDIVIKFVPGMHIQVFETVEIGLEGFTRDLGNGEVSVDCFGMPSCPTVEWMSGILTLNFTTMIYPGEEVKIRVPASETLKIGDGGLVGNQSSISIATNAQAGPVVNSPISSVPYVGLLRSTPVITFDPAVAGRVISIGIHFVPAIVLGSMDTIVLTLPDLVGDDFAGEDVTDVNGDERFVASWSASCPRNTLSISIRDGASVEAGESVQLLIPSSKGLKLPILGLPSNVTIVLTILTETRRGNTVCRFIPVGSFSLSDLSFSPAEAGAKTNATLTFKTEMSLAPMDRIDLILPSFGLNDDVAISGINANNFLAVRTSVTSFPAVAILAVKNFTAGALNTIILSGLTIPDEGVRLNDASISLSANAQDGVVLPQMLSSIQAVGSFNSSAAISFKPLFAGQATSINVSFVPSMRLVDGDVISVKLPGFSRPAGSLNETNVTVYSKRNSSDWVATWNNEEQILAVNVSGQIDRLARVSLIVGINTSIFIPINGVRTDDDRFTIETKVAAYGPVKTTRIVSIQGVGSFTNSTSISFDRVSESAPSDIYISFSPEMIVVAGETIRIKLPGFFSSALGSTSFNVTSLPSGAAQSVSWIANSTELVVLIGSTILPQTMVSVTVPATANIRLAIQGVRKNQASLTINTNAKAGIVPPTPFVFSQAVGSFSETTKLQFGLPTALAVAGEAAEITLTFTANMDLAPGSLITLGLPGFSSEASVIESLAASPDGSFYSASWSGVTSTLTMTVQLAVAAEQPVSVTIPSDSGVVLPYDGVRTNQTSITIETSEENGPVNRTSVVSVDPVGAIKGNSVLRLQTPKANESSILEFSLQTHMDLDLNDNITLFLPGFVQLLNTSVVVNWTVVTMRPAADVERKYPVNRNITLWQVSSILIPSYPFPRCELRNQTVEETRQVLQNRNETLPAEVVSVINISSKATWNSEAQALNLVVPLFLNASKPDLETSIGVKIAGLRVPEYGLKENQDTLLVKITANAGVVDSIPISISPAVGSFKIARIAFVNPVAGQPVNLTITIVPTMDIRQGENVSLILPGFGGPDTSRDAGHSKVGTVMWLAEKQKLTLLFKETTPAEEEVVITTSSFVVLPKDGVRRNQVDISISCDAAAGPVLPTIGIITEPVGTFLNTTRLSFSPAKAATASNITFSFISEMQINPLDVIALRLPGFEKPAVEVDAPPAFLPPGFQPTPAPDPSFSADVSAPGIVVTGSWSASDSVLSFTFTAESSKIAEHSMVSLTVPSSFSLMLPRSGIPQNLSTITVEAIVREGPVLPQSVVFTPAVGSFTETPTVIFKPPRILSPVAINITFVAHMDIRPGESVTFHLPKFGGPDRLELSGIGLWNVSWENLNLTGSSFRQNRLELTFVGNETVAALTNVSFEVPSTAGIMLPFEGVPSNWPLLTIESNAVAGPVLPSSVSSVQAVGSFLNSVSVSFSNAVASTSTSITVEFNHSMLLVVGDTVSLSLPAFTGNNVSGLSASAHRASWAVKAPSTLVLTVMREEPAFTLFTVIVPQHIALPFVGIRPNQQDLLISSDASNGPVLETEIDETQAVGSFTDTTAISFDNPFAGKAVAMTIGFSAQMLLTSPDYVFLSLPSFSSSNSIIRVTSQPEGFFTKGYWDAVDEILALPVNATAGPITQNSGILISVPSSNGIIIPSVGIRASAVLKISSNATYGPVLPTAVVSVPSVGSFMSSPTLILQPPKAGERVSLQLSLTPEMPLEIGDSIDLTLSNFTVDAEVVERIASVMNFSSFRVRAVANVLTLTRTTRIEAGSPITVSLPSSLGIIMPYKGIDNRLCCSETLSDCCVSLSSNAKFGPVLRTPVSSVSLVGALLDSELDFGNLVVGEYSNLTILFTSAMIIDAGEELLVKLPGLIANETAMKRGTFGTSSAILRWSQDSSTLTCVFTSRVSAWTRVSMLLNSSVYVPFEGITAGNKNFTFSIEAAAGPVPTTAFETVPGILTNGGFAWSRLDFFPRKAGSRAGVLVEFQALMTILPGDRITIILLGFKGPIMSAVASDGWLVEISNHSSSVTLELTAPIRIRAQVLTQVTIPSSVGVELPVDGLVANYTNLTIETNARAGPVSSQPVISSPAVGSFTNSTSLFFVSPRAGQACRMLLTFRASMLIAPGEVVRFHLGSFVGPFSNVSLESVFPNETGFVNASWRSGVLTIEAMWAVNASTPIRLAIDSSSGISLPSEGIAENSSTILVSSNAAAGPVLPTRVFSTQSVGSFNRSTSLSFTPAKAGNVAALGIDFTLMMAVQPSEPIIFRFPDFLLGSGTSALSSAVINWQKDNNSSLPMNEINAVVNTSLDGNFSLILSLSSPETLLPYQEYVVTVPSSIGIILPRNGVKTDEPRITVETNARSGPVLASSVAHTQSVGSFLSTPALSFSPNARAETATDVRLTFAAQMVIDIGEAVSVKLPGFTSPSIDLFQLSASSNFSSASWAPSASILSFTAARILEAGSFQSVSLPESAGLKVAADGVRRLSTVYKIQTNAVAGPVAETTIDSLQPVGDFVPSTSVSFSTRIGVDKETTVTLSFAPRMKVSVGELIEITLPGFTGNTSVFDVFWTPSLTTASKTGSWNSTTSKLTINSSLDISPLERVSASIPSTAGIRIPSSGVRTNQASITVGTNAIEGPIPATPADLVQAVGSFGGSPRIVYGVEGGGLGRASDPVSMLVSFTALMRLSPGDKVILVLPGFQGPSASSVIPDATNVAPQTFSASWSLDTNAVTISILIGIEPNFGVILLLPTTMGIVLPSTGLPANMPGLTISSTAVDGPVPATPIPTSPGVGYFVKSKILFTPHCNGGNTTDIMVSFSSRLGLVAQDTITVQMPFFTGPTSSQITVASDPADAVSRASWSLVTRALVLTVAKSISSQTEIAVTIPRSAAIQIPPNGVNPANTAMRISSNAKSGPVPPTPFMTVGPVGRLLRSDIRFTNTCQGTLTAITMVIKSSLPMRMNDTIHLSLLQPQGWLARNESVEMLLVDNIVTMVTANGTGAGVNIILTLGREVPAGQEWSTGILAIPGLQIPGTLGEQGMVTPVMNVQAISGAWRSCVQNVWEYSDMTCVPGTTARVVTDSSLTYNPPSTGVPTELKLTFVLGVDVPAGVDIVLSLPRFSLSRSFIGPAGTLASTDSSSIAVTSGVLSSNVTVITMQTTSGLSKGASVTLTVSEAAGIMLPANGTLLNQDDLKLVVQNLILEQFSWYGSRNYTTTISRSPQVGALLATKMSFSKMAAGTVVDIFISFRYTLDMVRGDVVDVFLDGFTGASTNSILSTAGGNTFRGSWASSSTLLSLTVDHPTQQIDANSLITVVIPSTTGITLPFKGVAANQKSILIKTNALASPVAYKPIMSTAQVSQYRCLASKASVTSPGSFCAGNNTVRVCAISQSDADYYATNIARPVLEQITSASCESQGLAECSAAGGSFRGTSKATCCRAVGVGDLALCTSDSQCVGGDNAGPMIENSKIPAPKGKCCEFCRTDLQNLKCNGGDAASCDASCAQNSPCYGRAISFVEVPISPAAGGAVTNDLGIGFVVPAGVWPEDAGPASVTYVETPTDGAMPEGSSFAGSAVTFEPSPMTFPEPGVTMVLPFTDDGDDTTVARAFKYVNGVWVQQPFEPVIDPVTGLASVKTLSFSTYVMMSVPAPKPAANKTATPSPPAPLVFVPGIIEPSPPPFALDPKLIIGCCNHWRSSGRRSRCHHSRSGILVLFRASTSAAEEIHAFRQ